MAELTIEGKAAKGDDTCNDEDKDEDMSEYAQMFINEGLKHKGDLATAPLLTDSELHALGIQRIGHRRKILRMHKKLLEQEGVLLATT